MANAQDHTYTCVSGVWQKGVNAFYVQKKHIVPTVANDAFTELLSSFNGIHRALCSTVEKAQNTIPFYIDKNIRGGNQIFRILIITYIIMICRAVLGSSRSFQ